HDDSYCQASSAHGPHCDTTNGHCVVCLVDADCNGGVCDTSTHECTGCLTSADCASSPDGAMCVNGTFCGCERAADGQSSPSGKMCDTSQHCACAVDADCQAGDVCDTSFPENVRCVPKCKTNVNCANDPTPHCDAASGHCVGCIDDTECPSGMHCDTA